MRIQIVIPAYNEAGRIRGTLETIHAYHRDGPHELIVTVVDDGSTDVTSEIVSRFRDDVWPEVRSMRLVRNQGKGAAVRYGMLHLADDIDWALLSDADLSAPIEEVETLAAHGREAGIVIGSRAVDPGLIGVSQPPLRRLMGKVFNLFVRALLFGGFQDTQCGFKLFRPHLAKQLFSELQTSGFAYDVEVIARALKHGYRVVEVPVRWNHVDQSRVSIIRAPAAMFLEILRIRCRLGRVRRSCQPSAGVSHLQKESKERPL